MPQKLALKEKKGYLVSLFSQVKVLLRKNAITTLRGANSPLLRIGSAFGFIVIIFLIDIALQADLSDNELYQNVFNPDVNVVQAIPDCSKDLYLKDTVTQPCYSLLYAPQDDQYVKELIDNVISSTDSKPERFMGMQTAEEIDAWMEANKEHAQAGVFVDVILGGDGKPRAVEYDLQTNSSVRYFKNEFQNPNFFAQVPVQVAIERESTRMLARYKDSSAEEISWNVGINSFAHPPMVLESRIPEFAAPFLYAACMFNFVASLSALVTERQTGQRQGMRNTGMIESSFWISWFLWELVTNFVTSSCLVLFGMIFQLLGSSFGIVQDRFWVYVCKITYIIS